MTSRKLIFAIHAPIGKLMDEKKVHTTSIRENLRTRYKDLTLEALTVRYAVLKSLQMLDELSPAERAQVSIMLARDLVQTAEKAVEISDREQLQVLQSSLIDLIANVQSV
ncbi:hypothetical protein MWU63_17445 [Pseudohalocynthiibacter sp. F2068]|nr:hypothetical protein [Pseudohalocynthiibacter sp. F2068]